MLKRLLFLIVILLTAGFFLNSSVLEGSASVQAINFHESIESYADHEKLEVVKNELGIKTTVLHSVPEGILRYNGESELNLATLPEAEDDLRKVTRENLDYYYFCSINPESNSILQDWQECEREGAKGLKLYNGYSYAHSRSLDDEALWPLYQLLQQEGVPIMMPVNVSLFQGELQSVLTSFPNLNIICSHYCSSAKNLGRLRSLMDTHKNLYLDTSWGHVEFAKDGLLRLTDQHDLFKIFHIDYQDRIVFATNVVVTSYEGKDENFLMNLYSDYLKMYTGKDFYSSKMDPNLLLRGLDLPRRAQQKILWRNAEALLN